MMTGLIALVVAAAAPLAPPPPARALPAATPRGAVALKALGMSDAGIAVLRQQGAPDPDSRALNAKRQTLRAKLAEAAGATPFDLDAFTTLLRESATLEASVRTRNEERIITTLKALPAADRPIFARAVFGPPPATGSTPVPAPRP